jgi:hypothetical protein
VAADTTPPRCVDAIALVDQTLLEIGVDDPRGAYVASQIVRALRSAGLLSLPEGKNNGTDAALAATISSALQRDFRLRIGPNTRRHITDGQTRIPLSLRECDDIAAAAVTALRKATP